MGAGTSNTNGWRAAGTLLVTAALMGLALFSIFHNNSPAPSTLELITYPGVYPTFDQKFVLRVIVDDDDEVDYQVTDKKSGVQIFEGKVGRESDRWCISWDGADNLWVCGEDDALVYVRVPGGDYTAHSLREKDYSKSMPPKFRRFFNDEDAE